VVYWWWLVFRGVIPGLRLALRRRFNDVLPLLVMLIGFGLLYSVTFVNVGMIYRQRAQLMSWLLTFAAVGLEQRHLRHLAWHAARRQQSQPDNLSGIVRPASSGVPEPGLRASDPTTPKSSGLSSHG
jgi:hypothetical protein